MDPNEEALKNKLRRALWDDQYDARPPTIRHAVGGGPSVGVRVMAGAGTGWVVEELIAAGVHQPLLSGRCGEVLLDGYATQPRA